MDTMMTIEHTPLLLASTVEESAPKVAAGRLPFMAFVDAESERVLQESSTLFGRHLIQKGGLEKAIDYLSQQRSPQLLIVDISGVDMPLTLIQTLAEVCEPGTDVVALGDRDSVALYRDLVEAGVSNYIVKPLTRDLIAKLLSPKRVVTKTSLKLGKIMSFVGARGGVGTTTMAANLAWHLANRQGRRVALVDLGLQDGDCALLFNAPITPGFWDALHNPLRLDHILLDRIMTQVSERLFVIAAQEPLDANVQFTASAIDSLFSVLRSKFHYVIVDVPHVQAPAYRRALEMADRRIVVVDQTMRSMRDAVRITNLFNDGMPDQRNSFVVNRVGEAGANALSMKDLETVLQVKPASLVPFAPKLVSPAASYAEIAASKRGKFGNALSKLSLELSGGRQRRKWWRAK